MPGVFSHLFVVSLKRPFVSLKRCQGHSEWRLLAAHSASLGWLRAPPGLGWSPAGLQNIGAALASLRATQLLRLAVERNLTSQALPCNPSTTTSGACGEVERLVMTRYQRRGSCRWRNDG